jgi:hypothetical protein
MTSKHLSAVLILLALLSSPNTQAQYPAPKPGYQTGTDKNNKNYRRFYEDFSTLDLTKSLFSLDPVPFTKVSSAYADKVFVIGTGSGEGANMIFNFYNDMITEFKRAKDGVFECSLRGVKGKGKAGYGVHLYLTGDRKNIEYALLLKDDGKYDLLQSTSSDGVIMDESTNGLGYKIYSRHFIKLMDNADIPGFKDGDLNKIKFSVKNGFADISLNDSLVTKVPTSSLPLVYTFITDGKKYFQIGYIDWIVY